MWTPAAGNGAHLDCVPSPGAPGNAKFASSPLKRTRSERPLRRRRVSALASQQRRETKWGPTRDSTRACHTHRAQRLPPSVHSVPRIRHPGAGLRAQRRAARHAPPATARILPEPFQALGGTRTLSPRAELRARPRSPQVHAAPSAQAGALRPPSTLFKTPGAEPFPTSAENFFLLPRRDKATERGRRCGASPPRRCAPGVVPRLRPASNAPGTPGPRSLVASGSAFRERAS